MKPPSSSNETSEPARHAASAGHAPFVLDELADVGPAAPSTASGDGVVLIEKGDQIALAKLDRRALLRHERRPGKTPIGLVSEGPAEFRAFERGPAVVGGRAYWVSKGRLVRRGVAGGGLQVLERDARDGTRVARPRGARESGPATVAYIAGAPDGSLEARLWVDGAGARDLTPDAAAASSVALAASGSSLVALSIEARTGMTPVHARRVRLDGSAVSLGPDVVVWVAGPAQSVTEIAALAGPGGVSAFIPLARDITRFGLAMLDVGTTPRMNTPVVWRAYPNGLDPAPLSAGMLCGRPAVLYVRPIDAKPGAPQNLEIAFVEGGSLGPPTTVASAATFVDVSFAAVGSAALIAYVADRRTWARTLRCRRKKTRR